MTIEEMKRRKKELGYSNAKVAELSGVPIGTVQKVFSGETSSPRYDTIRALEEVFGRTAAGTQEGRLLGEATAYAARRRTTGNFGHLGDKTIEDYIALPEGTRVELIDGTFYDMAAPTTIHQFIASIVFRDLIYYVGKNKGNCVPFVAPTDVQLDCDDKTMVQPDVLVVCDRSKITKARIVGAPDLVVEVVSPSNALTDVYLKQLKYKNAGVREYWIVFPEEKRIMVYDYTESPDPVFYTFLDSVPVGIWNGNCRVDFKAIQDQLDSIYSTD